MTITTEDPALTISIGARIARARPVLTRSHQQMADYVLAHPLQAATMPVDELADQVGVSIATANRFARAIGLDGYSMLRAELVRGFEAMLAPVEKMRARLEKPGSVHDAFVAALEESQRNVAATREMLVPASCEAAVHEILGARRVYVVGFGSSGWLSGMLHRYLESHCENVHLLTSVAGSSHGARLMPRMKTTDLLIAICFPRYITDTILLAQTARERGVRVLALTDGPQSPIAAFADCCLYAQTENYYAANSEASILALIEALASAVALQANESVQSAAQMTESVLPWLHGAESSRLHLRAGEHKHPSRTANGAALDTAARSRSAE
ncbi:MurR/RpiR family transcriptional regulator [Diaphorobacter aerolatus]|uniref:MurR/RpiR family transcriptional regulator n=1 Tax=Diaphorobacter aerolatus TaxID=1288495 RepID=A0A7H0GGH9_9BURK|nr:MurR/RpiR family transcriptional regulator [Diaphorobacter aerolatus]QNP47395.1 MurR/RpiR family transcriptional regulator [Diaphorobacter aerolatus]